MPTAPTRLAPTRLAAAAALLFVAQAAAAQDTAQDTAQDVTVTHAYSNFGEVKYGPDIAHLDYVNPDAPKGGEFSIATIGTFDSFNQYARDGVTAALNTIGTERIVAGTADDAYGVYCYLCTTMEYPADQKWVIFHLRDDVTFSDGTPMTAEDVAFTQGLFLEQGIAEYRAIIENFYEGVEVIDPYTVKFTFTDEAPLRDRISTAGSTPVFSKAWFEETGTRLDEASDAPFMSTGPYVLDSFETNARVVYRYNPDFWGADHPFNIGQNNFGTIRVEYFGDPTAAFEGFKAGAYTFRNENSSKNWATSYDFPGVQDGYVIRAELPDGTVGTAQSFVFNLSDPTWADPRVREALGMMFNFEWSNQSLFYGLYERVESFWPGSDLAATGTPTEGEIALLKPLVDEGLLPESILTDPVVAPPVNDPDQNRPTRSTYRAAGALLDAAGWEVADDGLRYKDGQVLEAVFLGYDPLFDRIINPIIENMAVLGVQAKLERVDVSQYIERRRSGDYDIVSHSFTMDFEPGLGLEQWFASKTADDSSRNLMRLKNPAVDKLIPAVIAADNLDDLTTAVHAFDRVLLSLRFTIPQWFKNKYTVAYYDMYEHPDEIPPYALGEMAFWWYNAEKHEALKAAGALR
ncbi:MAG: ABC transporter substrate-binding protein [Maritimibacter sp.]|nr:ABC transporter substrate-binding protein [Maritimibacter sp.]